MVIGLRLFLPPTLLYWKCNKFGNEEVYIHNRSKLIIETDGKYKFVKDGPNKFLVEPSYYDLLSLKEDVSDRAKITHAFREVMKEYHPDKTKDPEDEERSKHIVEARNVL